MHKTSKIEKQANREAITRFVAGGPGETRGRGSLDCGIAFVSPRFLVAFYRLKKPHEKAAVSSSFLQNKHQSSENSPVNNSQTCTPNTLAIR